MADVDNTDNAADALTLPAWLQRQSDRRASAVALRYKRFGIWEQKPWGEVAEEVRRLAAALDARGFGAGDTCLLLSHPRPEALLLSLAVQWLGGKAIPLDPAQSQQEITVLLQHLREVACVFAEDQQQLNVLLRVDLRPAAYVYADPRGLGAYQIENLSSYAALLEAGLRVQNSLQHVPHVQEEDTAFVFYQYDAQGKPRRQSVSHGELLKHGRGLVAAEQLTYRDEALAARGFAASGQARYLLAPWLVAGFCLNFPENLATRDNDRRELGPTLVVGTSATYQRLAQLVRDRLPEVGSWRRRFIEWALTINPGPVTRFVGYWLVRRSLLDVMGFTRTRAPLLVGEPLPESATHFFAQIGVAVRILPESVDWHYVDQSQQSDAVESIWSDGIFLAASASASASATRHTRQRA